MEKRKIIIAILIAAALLIFFFLAKQASPDILKEFGLGMSLPWFTFLIAIIDGFNPCTLWVLTFLLVLLISVSEDRKRILITGFTFVAVIFAVYFLFMAAWLNIFYYIGFIEPLRIAIALVAIIAGAINCKEFFAFRKGMTLMIQEKHKPLIIKKIEKMKEIIKYGSLPALITSSVVLAVFASLVELPCTAGWPIIYTGVLSVKVFEGGISYYFYLLLYNLIYIIPLSSIILVFGWFFKGRKITKEQTQIIKLIGGVIMIALGIVLLVNPELLMLIK